MDSGLSDCQLVVQAQDGCNKAFSELVRRYGPLLGYKAKVFFIMGAEKEDVFQEALIGFYKAIRDYKRCQRLSFKNFSEICINRQIISAIKYACRFKHMPLYRYKRLSKVGSTTARIDDPLEGLMLKEWLSQLELSLKDLSITERRALRLSNQGLSYEEIAQRMSITKKQVDNTMQRVRQKLKSIFGKLRMN